MDITNEEKLLGILANMERSLSMLVLTTDKIVSTVSKMADGPSGHLKVDVHGIVETMEVEK